MMFNIFKKTQKPVKTPSEKIAEAQAEIDGTLVAKMQMEFYQEFKDVYDLQYPVSISIVGGVGPMASFLGLAIKNGHLKVNSEKSD